MSRKRYTPEQIISMLREAEVALAQGQSVGQACRTLGVSEQSYYRWRKEYGGLRTDQAKRLKDLEKENGRLRKAISDLTLDKLILKEALEGNCQAPPVAGSVLIISRPNWESPSDVPALLQANIAQPSARDPVVGMMKRHSRPRSSAWPASMADMAIGGSLPCSGPKVGT